MNNGPVPRLAKWPFYLGDMLLLLVALWVVYRQPVQLDAWQGALVVLSVAAGALLGVVPFLLEYRAALRFAEADQLATAVMQIQRMEAVGDDIKLATSQWQTVQEHCQKTVFAAHEIAQQMTAEAKNFAEFMQKANDAEKSHLRLEVEKARRVENEWLQVLVRMLDHVYALYTAGARSGQPMLYQQLGQFQSACRDIVRRVGLMPIDASEGEVFDEMKHQLAEPDTKAPGGAVISETIATGYTFQGQLLRPPLVRVKEPPAPETATLSEPAAEPEFPAEPPPEIAGEPESVVASEPAEEPPPETASEPSELDEEIAAEEPPRRPGPRQDDDPQLELGAGS